MLENKPLEKPPMALRDTTLVLILFVLLIRFQHIHFTLNTLKKISK